jgi:hypothetical protein
MSEFDPDKPARVYDNLNERFFDWNPKNADHYRKTARPYRDEGYEELTDYDGLELPSRSFTQPQYLASPRAHRPLCRHGWPADLSPPFPHDRARHEARPLAPARGGLLFAPQGGGAALDPRDPSRTTG